MSAQLKPIELCHGCPMCGHRVHDCGICQVCRDHSENIWTDDAGNEYSDKEAARLLNTGEAIEVEL